MTRIQATQGSTCLISRALSGDDVLSSALSVEESNRGVADQSLSTALSTEVSHRLSGDQSLSSALSTEVSNRILTSVSSAISILSSSGPGYLQILSTPTTVTVGSVTIGDLQASNVVFIPANLSVGVNVSAAFFSAN